MLRARNQSLLYGFAHTKTVVDRAKQQQLTQQVQPGREKEEEPELGPVGVEPVFGLATGVSVSRVHLGHHFPSDVVVGSLIGIATGTLASWLTKLPDIL